MFCMKCGAKNDDTAAFCAECGSPLKTAPTQQQYYAAPQQPAPPVYNAAPQQPYATEQSGYQQPYNPSQPADGYQQPYAPEQPGYYQQPYNPAQGGYYQQPYDPAQAACYGQPQMKPAKKKPWPIIALAVAAVAVVALVLVLLLGGGSGYDTPEEAALAFAEGSYTADWDLCESAIHPDMVTSEMEEEFEAVADEVETRGIEAKNYEADRVEDYDDDEVESTARTYERRYDLKVTDAKRVRVLLDVYADMFGGWTEGVPVYIDVIEVDGEWYVIPDM